MSSVSIRIDLGGSDYLPHTFLVVTHPDGRQTEYGLVPATANSPDGPGRIDITGPGAGFEPHESDYEVATQQLTDAQYVKLMEGINRSIGNPPPYLLPGNWASSSASPDNCTGWAIAMWRYAEIPDVFGTTSWSFSPYGQAIGHSVNTLFNAARNWTTPRDPLVLDLDGDGIETLAINPAAPILFDMDADGVKTGTGWIKPDDALVVLDRNGNGLIDSGAELFGDSTVLQNGPKAGQKAAHGFEALADLDANADGVINNLDAAYASLRLWQDANLDGISQSTELKTLAEMGIASIEVAGTSGNVDLGGGNTQVLAGSFTRTTGQSGTAGVAELAGSLLLASNGFYREFADNPVVTAAAALPEMQGRKNLRQKKARSCYRSKSYSRRLCLSYKNETRLFQIKITLNPNLINI